MAQTQTSRIAQAYVQLVPSTVGFGSLLSGQLSQAVGHSNAGGAGAAMGEGILSGLKKVLAAAAIGLIIDKGFEFAKERIKAGIEDASDLNENIGAVQAVFKGAAQEVINFSAHVDKELGLSQNAALSAAKNFGIFGSAAGLQGDKLVEFNETLTRLAADLSSFGNTTPEEALTALSAGLRGESEPLRQYGILLDDLTLRQAAMKLGIYDGNGALTAQQRILAAESSILAQSKTQMGAFARESSGFSGQMAILGAQLENSSTQFGKIFLPTAIASVTRLNNVGVPLLNKFIAKLSELSSGEFIKSIKENPLFDQILDYAFAVYNAVRPLLDAIVPIIGQIVAAFMPLIPIVVDLFTQFSPLLLILQAVQNVIPLVAQAIGSLVSGVAPILVALLKAAVPVVGALATAFAEVLAGAIQTIVPAVISLVTGLLPLIQDIFPVLNDIIVALLPVVLQLANMFGTILAQAVKSIVPIVLQLAQLILPVFSALLPGITAVIDALMPIIQIVAGLLVNVLGQALKVIIPVVSAVIKAFMPLLKAILPVIADLLIALTPLIQLIAELLGNTLRVALAVLLPVFQAIINIVANTLTGAFKGLIPLITGIVKFLTGAIWGIISIITLVYDGIARVLNLIKIDVPKFAQSALGVKQIGFKLPIIDFPKMPALATGANVMGPTVALLGEERPETVTDLGTTNAFIASTLKLVQSLLGEGITAQQIIDLKIYPSEGMNENEFADKVVKALERKARKAARR